jgi:hypothetical protein
MGNLRRATDTARRRYDRRRSATSWFWRYWRAKWEKCPPLAARVSFSVVRDVPQLAFSPRRHTHIVYEDCVHVEEQAAVLLRRLQHHPMLGRGPEI